uniref:Lipase 2 n=1 Tax=Rhodotorula toruloides TaxID=5286 RepID=A0A2Z6EYU5_RHOTO|nr:lipase 2 [Rhodotorula toruloides]
MTTLASTSAAAIRLTAGCAAAAVATTSPSTTAAFNTSTPVARALGADTLYIQTDGVLSGIVDGSAEGARRKVRRRRIVAGAEEEDARRGTVSAAVELRFILDQGVSFADNAGPAAFGAAPPSLDTLSSPTPPSARSTTFGVHSRRLRRHNGLWATAGYLRDRSTSLSAHARPLSTAPALRKPTLDISGDARPPPQLVYADNRTTNPLEQALRPRDLSATHEASQPVASRSAPAEKAATPTLPSASADSAGTLDKPLQRPKPPPRPPSPYGEINELVRHPLLYDPVLKPRFPIVLCHGLYGFDVRGPGFFRLHYWGDLLKILRGKIGAEVFVTAVPGTGSVKNRAYVLHKALEDTPSLLNRDLNFVGHSMGGLDARYLISNIRPTLYHPRSLTTMCTPHRGSEFMAWCRANIGIGTEFESHEALNLRAPVSSNLDEPDDASVPLPYSLKSPILSREQVEQANKAAEAAKRAEAVAEKAKDSSSHFPGLPFNLSASVTGYLLKLLDSPAYANLTPSFLRDVFNPSTPNRDDVRYFSIAARTDKIPIWHPLWLPKLVLDGAESQRVAQGCAAPPEWRGNDGLVSIDSARWGEFLGTFDVCDHWEMRGSSGLSSAEASKHAIEEVTRREIRETKEPKEGGQAERVASAGVEPSKEQENEEKGWQWQDVYALVGKLVGGGNGKKKVVSATAKAEGQLVTTQNKDVADAPQASAPRSEQDQADDDAGLASAASWIIRQLPGASVGSNAPASSSKDATPTSPLPPLPNSPTMSSIPPTSSSSPLSSVSSTVTSAAATVADTVINNPATRLLYGAPGLSSSASDKAKHEERPKKEKFSLERMTVALCRKLHKEGF